MEIEIMSGLSELGFRLVRVLIKYFDFLSHVPYLKIATLGFGAAVVYIKRYVNPRTWKKSKKKA